MIRTFGRRIQFDERSREYPIRKVIRKLEPISQMWDFNKEPFDQDRGCCVACGICHEFIATPVPCMGVTYNYAIKLYEAAQLIDPWPETPPEEGTSVKAGLQIAKEWGWCDEYRWSFTHLDTQLGVAYEGPGICGSNWYAGMDNVDSEGFIHPTGFYEGGHCYLFLGVNIEQQYFTILNSWGNWGIDGTGRAKLSFDDYEKLRKEDGEMAFLIGRHDIGEEPVSPEPEPPEPEPSDCQFSNSVAKALNLLWRLGGRQTRFQTRKGVIK